MLEAIKEAEKAYANGDVPIGAIIVKENEIVSRGYNQKELLNTATKHAEIIAIEKACNKLGNWRLNECILYVTVEPCLMCCGAIIQSRIKKVVFSIPNEKFGFVTSIDSLLNKKNNHIVQIESGLCAKQSEYMLKKFFRQKRK